MSDRVQVGRRARADQPARALLFPGGMSRSASVRSRPVAFRLSFLMALATGVSGSGCGRSDGVGPIGGDAALDGGGGGDGAVGDGGTTPDDGALPATTLVINELCADDDGFQIDESGQADDWVELRNVGARPVALGGFTLDEGGTRRHPLPAETLAPGATLLLWTDGSPDQGPRHLDFRLSAAGGKVVLRAPAGAVIDEVSFPALDTNIAYARFPDGASTFAACRYATPGRANGSSCGPPAAVDPPPEVTFAPYTGAPPGPTLAGPLVVSQLVLEPAPFVEITNVSANPVLLTSFSLRLAAHRPGVLWPDPQQGALIPWSGSAALAAGARRVIALRPQDLAVLGGPGADGVIALFASDGRAVARLDFAGLPEGISLALLPAEGGGDAGPLLYRLCRTLSPGLTAQTCDPLPTRTTGDSARQLLTADDLRALAEGDTRLESLAVKVIVDLQAGEAVHFLAARRWPLHYTFIREQIYGQPRLDRCDATQAAAFEEGWREFSAREYFVTEGRRFLLATLVRHGGSGLLTLEFDRGDTITGPMMRRAFFAVAARTQEPHRLAIRPQGERQTQALKAIEGTVPVVDGNAPFRGITLQALTPGVGYGVLKFMPAAELARARLGLDTIVVTDDVPNDVPLLGGLITEVFQTPLSHVSVLTRNRGTPNLALAGAREDARLRPWFGKLVRLEVGGGTFTMRAADSAEAEAFWKQRRPQGPRVMPRRDLSLRGLQDLRLRSLDDLPALGAKAAQMGELLRVVSSDAACLGPIPAPASNFALPIVHGLEHFEESGARRILDDWRAKPGFATDPAMRAEGLAEVRAAIAAHPVKAELVAAIEALARRDFGTRRFRLRSSSNTEDLSSFSGAGLYLSVSAALDDPERTIADGLREVWASLWADRAWDERELGNIDQSGVAMGILIHEAFDGVERANGVLVSRDIHNPIEGSVETVNAQFGEASVTNPAPGVTSESMTFAWWKTPAVVTLARSNLRPGSVLSAAEISLLACHIRSIETHFRARLDPSGSNRWFAMESEFKLVGPERRPVLKQARPYSFGQATIPVDCREL